MILAQWYLCVSNCKIYISSLQSEYAHVFGNFNLKIFFSVHICVYMNLYIYIYIVNVKVAQSCTTLCDPLGWNTGVGGLSLIQGLFPMQRLSLGLPHCRWILYQLSHKGSPRMLEWVVYPFSRGSSHSGIELKSPALHSLPTELSGKPYIYIYTF